MASLKNKKIKKNKIDTNTKLEFVVATFSLFHFLSYYWRFVSSPSFVHVKLHQSTSLFWKYVMFETIVVYHIMTEVLFTDEMLRLCVPAELPTSFNLLVCSSKKPRNIQDWCFEHSFLFNVIRNLSTIILFYCRVNIFLCKSEIG